MADELGGKYFREARFFLAGDRELAGSHAGAARMLMGQMRDSHTLGGPPIQVRYATMQDGTQIRATMMNGQYQAQIVSPGSGASEPKWDDILFVEYYSDTTTNAVRARAACGIDITYEKYPLFGELDWIGPDGAVQLAVRSFHDIGTRGFVTNSGYSAAPASFCRYAMFGLPDSTIFRRDAPAYMNSGSVYGISLFAGRLVIVEADLITTTPTTYSLRVYVVGTTKKLCGTSPPITNDGLFTDRWVKFNASGDDGVVCIGYNRILHVRMTETAGEVSVAFDIDVLPGYGQTAGYNTLVGAIDFIGDELVRLDYRSEVVTTSSALFSAPVLTSTAHTFTLSDGNYAGTLYVGQYISDYVYTELGSSGITTVVDGAVLPVLLYVESGVDHIDGGFVAIVGCDLRHGQVVIEQGGTDATQTKDTAQYYYVRPSDGLRYSYGIQKSISIADVSTRAVLNLLAFDREKQSGMFTQIAKWQCPTQGETYTISNWDTSTLGPRPTSPPGDGWIPVNIVYGVPSYWRRGSVNTCAFPTPVPLALYQSNFCPFDSFSKVAFIATDKLTLVTLSIPQTGFTDSPAPYMVVPYTTTTLSDGLILRVCDGVAVDITKSDVGARIIPTFVGRSAPFTHFGIVREQLTP